MDTVTLQLDQQLYSKEVLLKTAYSFTDRVYLHLAQDGNGRWLVSWTCKEGCELRPEAFENELIAQELRSGLLEKTAEVRKLILARAFASTVVDTAGAPEAAAPAEAPDDPQDILKGWFDGHD